jgi:hypothetical protein
VAWIEGVCDLILTTGSGSDSSGRLGAQGGGAGHRRLVSAAARGSVSPNFAKSDAPVAKSNGAWVWDGLRDMHNPPRSLAELGRALGCGCDDHGGSAWHGITGVCAFGRASARIQLQKGVCSAGASQGKVRAALQEACHDEAAARAAAEHRRPVFRYLRYAWAYDI